MHTLQINFQSSFMKLLTVLKVKGKTNIYNIGRLDIAWAVYTTNTSFVFYTVVVVLQYKTLLCTCLLTYFL